MIVAVTGDLIAAAVLWSAYRIAKEHFLGGIKDSRLRSHS
jgi:hypothetical protein